MVCAAFALGTTGAWPALAEEPAAADVPVSRAALEKESGTRVVDKPKPDLSLDIEARKSYAIPALEILGFDFLLNRFNRYYFKDSEYSVNLSTIQRNLRSSWAVDNDPLEGASPLRGAITTAAR